MTAKVEFKLLGETLPLDVRTNGFVSREAMSTPYTVEVDFATLDESFESEKCLRASMTLEVIDTDRGRARTFSGICDACEFTHHDGTHFIFRARLRPPVAALAHREDSRIYQDKSIVDVVKELLSAAGVDKVDYRLGGSYPPREYIVQYQESELTFFHRLLEDEGIFYFFEHAEGEVTMVLTDAIETAGVELAFPVRFAMSQGILGTDPLEHFSLTRKLRTSNVTLRDFDFEKPPGHPMASLPAEDAWPASYYEYPGGFVLGADGQRRVAARVRELRRDAVTVSGSTNVPNLEVGKLIGVGGAAQENLNGNFVVTELRSHGTQAISGDGGNAVSALFTGIPEGAPYAAPRTARRARIRGIQTAVVTGPSMGEEEIHVDNYGRIKVRFHWDRVGQFDDKSSCWIRVMQVPLGGGMVLPRVGWEVAVAFAGGDPDRPYVVGRVYNGERVPPYGLPGAKTSGAIKSASSPGGAGINEIMLGDSGGGQGFNVNAQKDLNVTIGHDQNETVAVDDSTHIKVNATGSVGANQTTSVGGNQELNVGSVASANVTGDQSISVGGNAVDNTTANYVEKSGGDRSESVGGNKLVICNGVAHTIGGDLVRTVGAVQLCASIASISNTVGGDVSETIGIAKIDLCKGGWGETITGNRTVQLAAADLHIVKGSHSSESEAATTVLVGGLRYSKVAGDYTIKAPMITLLGATGTFKGGGSELKLGGSPILVKGSKIAVDTALMVKLGSSLKMGP